MSDLLHPLPRRMSASSIRRFDTCPKQFYLADVARAERENLGSPRLTQANAIHHALERFYGLPLGDRSVENLRRALRAIWPAHRGVDTFLDKEEERAYGLEALWMLETYAASFDLNLSPLAREQWLQVRLASGADLVGKLDRLDRRPDGRLDVIDYKTSDRVIDEQDLSRDLAAQIYAVLAQENYGGIVASVRFIYLPVGTVAVWRPEQEDIDDAKVRIEARIAEIRACQDFSATPGPMCRYCPFALGCAERQQVSLDDIAVSAEVGF